MSISTMNICRATSIRNAPKGDRIKVLRYHMGLRFSSSKRLWTMTLFHNMCIRCINELQYGRVYELTAASCRDTMFMAVHTRTLAAFTKITSATPVLSRPREVKWCITNWRLDGNIRVYHLLKAGLSRFGRVTCHI